MITFFRFQTRTLYALLVGIVTMSGLIGCADLSNPDIPEGTQSPKTYHSKQGALMLTLGTTRDFRSALVPVTILSGLLTDEFSSHSSGTSSGFVESDSRDAYGMNMNTMELYGALHKVRGNARLARGLLTAYAQDLSPAIRGQLYALEGYAELFLADMFCSGVPLTTLDFDGDFTYQPSSTTEQVYTHAVTLFDSALALVADSINLQTVARVGKGRALLMLGRYHEAAAAVANVADTHAYKIRIRFRRTESGTQNLFGDGATVSDREGENGLPFLSSHDPRTRSDTVRYIYSNKSVLINFPNKYSFNDSTWFVVASGIEASLIRAEAALHGEASGNWLMMLNALRTSGTYSRIDTTASGEIDTLWDAGSGAVAGLGPLQDPGTLDDQIAMLFRERAMWLFASAQRQGDLRRLVRVYGYDREHVYPTGMYRNRAGSRTGYYGGDIDFPIPTQEQRNPYFRGCLND